MEEKKPPGGKRLFQKKKKDFIVNGDIGLVEPDKLCLELDSLMTVNNHLSFKIFKRAVLPLPLTPNRKIFFVSEILIIRFLYVVLLIFAEFC